MVDIDLINSFIWYLRYNFCSICAYHMAVLMFSAIYFCADPCDPGSVELDTNEQPLGMLPDILYEVMAHAKADFYSASLIGSRCLETLEGNCLMVEWTVIKVGLLMLAQSTSAPLITGCFFLSHSMIHKDKCLILP